jgi:UDP-glucose 4-epimerase
VLEFVEAFNEVADRPVEIERAPRRPGDSAGAYTRSTRAADLLGWRAEHSVADGIRDSLAWFAQRERILPDLAR